MLTSAEVKSSGKVPPTGIAKRLRVALLVCALLLAFTAVNHARLALLCQGVVWRHGLFAALDLVAAALVASGWRHAVFPLAALAIQQTYSHGSDLVGSIGAPPFDWTSLGVVLFFPLLVTLLVVARRANTSGSPREAPPRS